MPLLLQARITSVSFEEARYRHYRAQQRRGGALQKAAAQVRQRAPSPFDEDAAQATRRLFARTVAQVVEIHALERTFDAWRSLEARPKAPPTLPARPPSNGAPDEAKYDPRALDLGARLAQRVLDDRLSRSRLQQWSSITKRPASPALSSLTEDFVVVEDAPPPPPPIESPVSPALSDQRRELADVIAKNCGIVALCRSLSRRRRADAFRRWASRHRTEHANGLESALFEAQRTLDARRTLVALDDAWRRRRRERLRRVIGIWRALSAAGNVAAAEAEGLALCPSQTSSCGYLGISFSAAKEKGGAVSKKRYSASLMGKSLGNYAVPEHAALVLLPPRGRGSRHPVQCGGVHRRRRGIEGEAGGVDGGAVGVDVLRDEVDGPRGRGHVSHHDPGGAERGGYQPADACAGAKLEDRLPDHTWQRRRRWRART